MTATPHPLALTSVPPSARPSAAPSVPDLPPLVLLVEPRLERREVLEHRARVDLLLARHRLERLGPRPALAHLQHRGELLPGRLVAVDGAQVQRSRVARLAAEGALELEL